MTATVLLEITTADGLAAWRDAAGRPRAFQMTPADVFDDWQPGTIPIRLEHLGPTVGHVDYLEAGLGHGAGLYAVGVVEVPDRHVDRAAYCSPEIVSDALAELVGAGKRTEMRGNVHASRAELVGVALVAQTAGVGASRVRAWAGDYLELTAWDRSHLPAIIGRAAAASRWNTRTTRPHKLPVHRPAGEAELEVRSGGREEVCYSAWYPGVLSVR